MAVGADWLQAQYSVLGSVLISPELVPKLLHETGEMDFQGPCRTIWRAIRKLFLDGKPIDPVSVVGLLGKDYRQFLVELMEVTPTSANFDHYVQLCREQSQVINLQELGRMLAEESNPEKQRSLLAKANGLTIQKANVRRVSTKQAMEKFYQRHVGPTNFIQWPIPEMNRRIYAREGRFIIIAGNPSTGKTAWALQCAWFWAKSRKVGFYSLETDDETVTDRQIASLTGISKDDILNNEISEAGWDKIAAISAEFTETPFDIIPAAGWSTADLRADILMNGYKVVFIDYLQLLRGSGENRTAMVTQISIDLHTMAQDLDVMIVALSQLSRDNGQNARSEMSRMRESGQIEQDADIIMILKLEDEEKPSGNRILSMAKNKEGTRPKILLAFDGQTQTFSKAKATSEVVAKYSADGKKARQRNKALAGQFTMLPSDTPVPF